MTERLRIWNSNGVIWLPSSLLIETNFLLSRFKIKNWLKTEMYFSHFFVFGINGFNRYRCLIIYNRLAVKEVYKSVHRKLICSYIESKLNMYFLCVD